MNSNKTLLFAYDAGSANVTMAYAYKVNSQGGVVEAYPKGPAIEIYEKNISKLIKKEPVFTKNDVVVVGTSGIHSEYEMQILKKAKQSCVKKTIVILDSIDKLETRFVLDNKPLTKQFYPDEIWTPSLEIELAYNVSKIIKVDDLYLEYVYKTLYKTAPNITHPLITRYKDKYLVILSEYVRELFGDKFGFDEVDSINHILNTVDSSVPIFIKTHPAEPKDKYKNLIEKSNLNIYAYEGDIHELIYYSKVVFGINSSVFKEALFLKKPTYSIQIGSCQKMDDILDEQHIIYDVKKLTYMLNYYFGDKS